MEVLLFPLPLPFPLGTGRCAGDGHGFPPRPALGLLPWAPLWFNEIPFLVVKTEIPLVVTDKPWVCVRTRKVSLTNCSDSYCGNEKEGGKLH